MAESVAIKLKVGHVDTFGGVWLAGMVVYVSAERAKKLVDAGEAEYATTSAPKPVSTTAKKESDK